MGGSEDDLRSGEKDASPERSEVDGSEVNGVVPDPTERSDELPASERNAGEDTSPERSEVAGSEVNDVDPDPSERSDKLLSSERGRSDFSENSVVPDPNERSDELPASERNEAESSLTVALGMRPDAAEPSSRPDPSKPSLRPDPFKPSLRPDPFEPSLRPDPFKPSLRPDAAEPSLRPERPVFGGGSEGAIGALLAFLARRAEPRPAATASPSPYNPTWGSGRSEVFHG